MQKKADVIAILTSGGIVWGNVVDVINGALSFVSLIFAVILGYFRIRDYLKEHGWNGEKSRQ